MKKVGIRIGKERKGNINRRGWGEEKTNKEGERKKLIERERKKERERKGGFSRLFDSRNSMA